MNKDILSKDNYASYSKGKYNTFIKESTCDDGSVVFRATISGVPVSKNEGIWVTDSSATTKYKVAIKGMPAAMLPQGVVFSRFIRVHLTANGNVVLLAQVSGPGVNTSNDQGIWSFSLNDGLALIAREGSVAPGAGGARYGTFQNFDMAPEERYLMTATLTQCSTGNNLGLFNGHVGSISSNTVSNRVPMLQLRKGSQFIRNGSPLLQSIGFTRTTDTAGFSGKGLGCAVTDGPCAVMLQFADGSADLMRGTL